MMQEAEDFRAESRALLGLLTPTSPDRFSEPTQFKAWTLNDVLRHLHVWNDMARLQIEDEAEIVSRLGRLQDLRFNLRDFEVELLADTEGASLLAAWSNGVEHLADVFAAADPKQRLVWAGPSMSARSSITARLMETWAHGQEVYDHLGVERENTDRIRGIAVLGINTFGWTYKTRGLEPPGPMPKVRLTAPSGDVWSFGEADATGLVEGSATEFCQVVTQTRHIADTQLTVVGDVASDWMSKAQCFAGPPVEPPAPGTRYRKTA